MKRRHLTPSELAFVALEIEKYEAEQAKKRQAVTQFGGGGINATTIKDNGKARDKAAAAVGVSPRYVQDAKKLATESPAPITLPLCTPINAH